MCKDRKQKRCCPRGLCEPLGGLACLWKFFLPGCGFSSLVCLCLLALILFYTGMPCVSDRFPVLGKVLTRTVSALLALGLAVCAVTEGFVIKASFGSPNEQTDSVVVLGAKVRSWGPSVSLWDRIYAAADYLKAHPEVIAVVSGGQGADEPETEAGCMYRELVNLGVEPERILIEDRAKSTWENIRFSLDLLEKETGARPAKLGVVSSEYHLFRASLFAKNAGVQFVGIPAKTSRLGQKINHFMREVAGVWHYILLGGGYDA